MINVITLHDNEWDNTISTISTITGISIRAGSEDHTGRKQVICCGIFTEVV